MKRHDQTEKKRRLIWLDWLLLLLLIGSVGGGVWYWHVRSAAAEPTVKIEYVLRISGVDDTYSAQNGGWDVLIPRGAQVTTSNGTAVLGRVSDLVAHPHVEADVRGRRIVFIEHEGRSDLSVTVRGEGIAREGDGIRIRDLRIAAGSVGDFRVGSFYASNVTIVSVKRRDPE